METVVVVVVGANFQLQHELVKYNILYIWLTIIPVVGK